MTNANVFGEALDATEQTIDSGDVALLLKADGRIQALTFGYDRTRLSLPADQHTEKDRKMLDQGARLFALAFAVGHPKLMQVLIDIASDPDVVDFDTLTAMKTRH